MHKLTVLIAPSVLLTTTQAHAYIGPGVGAGTIAVVLGIFAAVFLALVGVLWYPFKRLMKKRKTPDAGKNPGQGLDAT